jgi:aminoglycoside phosphotransferase (APT) family kinase protein
MWCVPDDAAASPDGRPGQVEAEVVERALHGLGWHPPTQVVRKLAGGASGSQVFLLDTGAERLVLKVTEALSWRVRAERELRLYRELGTALQEFVPALRAWVQDRHGVRLLLTAHQPQPPAETLTDDAWVAVAERLGRLHSAPIPPTPWLPHHREPSSREVAAAVDRWAGRGAGPLATQAAEQLAATRDARGGTGNVLTHGDCHLHNLLTSPEGHPLWVDWQEVSRGGGLDDLVFLWQRAEFDGAHPPREEMTAAYAAARSLPAEAGLRAGLAAVELRLLLVAWPPFLPLGSPERQAALTRRLEQLVQDWSRS